MSKGSSDREEMALLESRRSDSGGIYLGQMALCFLSPKEKILICQHMGLFVDIVTTNAEKNLSSESSS